MEGKVGNESMAGSSPGVLGRTHPSPGARDVQGAELSKGGKPGCGRGRKGGGSLEGAKSWRDRANTWGLTKLTGWARMRIWILSQTRPFFREKNKKK